MNRFGRWGLGMVAVALGGSCTTLDEPREAEARAAVGPDDAGAEPDVDAAFEIPCARTHDWRIRGLPASFYPAPESGVGAWGIGDYFKAPDMAETVILDAYVAGSAEELRGRRVPLGVGHNTRLSTLTHLIVLRLGCADNGAGCDPDLYVPVSGEVVVTRLQPDNATSLELVASNVVLRRGRVRGDSFELTEGPENCEFFHRLVIAGQTYQPTRSCAEFEAAACPFLENARNRHP